ncbi:unnamed protein product [Bursaphelenchus xylophilus]|uniref:(pine wood nematode) hypothetical protein n=1 Tax=Bursaphelenchus xylophilus TaxID=6326 RepID=A0A1I7SLC6_BURXY|nr:unnamed protein product [Bursaphelenchus xylophilus]CAG9129492.1 unnamed protein product [Bursaphelenchus xylophilus]
MSHRFFGVCFVLQLIIWEVSGTSIWVDGVLRCRNQTLHGLNKFRVELWDEEMHQLDVKNAWEEGEFFLDTSQSDVFGGRPYIKM